jgi:hypothetical protein
MTKPPPNRSTGIPAKSRIGMINLPYLFPSAR